MSDTLYGFVPVKATPRKSQRGCQLLYRFDNGYGASVVPGHYEDEREVAVIRWNSEDEKYGWVFDWDTPVPKLPIRVGLEGIQGFLTEVAKLPPREG